MNRWKNKAEGNCLKCTANIPLAPLPGFLPPPPVAQSPPAHTQTAAIAGQPKRIICWLTFDTKWKILQFLRESKEGLKKFSVVDRPPPPPKKKRQRETHTEACSHLSGIENLQYPCYHFQAIIFLLLTDDLNITQLSKIEISLFFNTVDSQLQAGHLTKKKNPKKKFTRKSSTIQDQLKEQNEKQTFLDLIPGRQSNFSYIFCLTFLRLFFDFFTLSRAKETKTLQKRIFSEQGPCTASTTLTQQWHKNHIKTLAYCNRRNFHMRFKFVYFVLQADSTKFCSIRKPCTYTSICDTAPAVRKCIL